ncbi:uncharacterized protein AMSG_11907 [Thecamonas trahens ATCC 50062]|uniref:ABC transporter domain-containing protein n=1 Tax=Thecamonas trahens ATCC 50062 TaxID=461836 RepID=A0A0L0DCM8_THETB|nr:hypothetical protein AMSG_11907 [Thecamonas trahens ATCC 50062]KNC50005.1 hypothetical protein AMSG_11907 [Thecamonas trahens ATCC 50062]|eukprot:XP_013757300.1 hypothetical protein AMSG_11907 [Thecamonas trahens ATCC 50062]
MREGEILALLGHNGAGKSSTIKAMLSLVAPSQGSISVFGLSTQSQAARHDILWPELSARQHLRLFAHIRGVPWSKVEAMVEEKLEAVRLTNVGSRPAGTYSGGMRRRLSVAIATIGDVRFVVLDEPTTGMDVVNRQHVWRMIQRLKAGRIVLVTSHSMLECDTLGDKIAIMTAGRLSCVGDSLHLKNAYGSGYSIAIIAAAPEAVSEITEAMGEVAPLATVGSVRGRKVNFAFQSEAAVASVPHVFAWIETVPNLISDWGVSQTTLEDVFLNVGKLEEESKAQHEWQ